MDNRVGTVSTTLVGVITQIEAKVGRVNDRSALSKLPRDGRDAHQPGVPAGHHTYRAESRKIMMAGTGGKQQVPSMNQLNISRPVGGVEVGWRVCNALLL